MKAYPFCTIIVLNYQGEKVLANTLDSLLSLDYPENKYEIIIVDNNSTDSSRKTLIKYSKDSKSIKPVLLTKNYGFSKGNNYGIKKSKGEYVVLLNNDCTVYKNWLKELIKTAMKDKNIFAVNSKILLYPKFINVNFAVNPKLVPVYAWLLKSKLYNYEDSKLVYLPLWRKPADGQVDSGFITEIPYEPYNDESVVFTLLFSSRGSKFSDVASLRDFITFENNSIKITNITINGDDVEFQITLKLSETVIIRDSLNKIQNAGILVFQDGYGRDIGAMVRAGQQFYEYDLKQYDKEKEVYAACGAAVLYNKRILDKIGNLDESFFMYYEDVEICERARFAGFKTVYSPKAVVRHYHALTSKEWSPFFTYQVEKGRLLHVFYNFPFRVFLREYFYLFFYNLAFLFTVMFRLKEFFYVVRSRKQSGAETKYNRRIQIVKALSYLFFNLPVLLLKRFNYSKNRKKNAVEKNYQKLLNGDWYLK